MNIGDQREDGQKKHYQQKCETISVVKNIKILTNEDAHISGTNYRVGT